MSVPTNLLQATVIGSTEVISQEEKPLAVDQPPAGHSGFLGDDALLLQLRVEIRQGFEQLSARLVQEIRDSLSDSIGAPRPSFSPNSRMSRLRVTDDLVGDVPPQNIELAFKEEPSADQPTRVSSLPVEASGFKQSIESVIEKHERGLRNHFNHIVTHLSKSYKETDSYHQRCLYRFVYSKAFVMTSMLLILTNAIWMGYESDQKGQKPLREGGRWPRTTEDDWFDSINMVFGLWFMAELLLKMAALRKDFIFGPDWSWNLLDLILVAFSIPDLFSKMNMNVSMLRLLRLMRLTRGVRLVRLLKYFVTLREILVTMFYTMGSLFWSFVAIVLVAYMFALVMSQTIRQSRNTGATFTQRTTENFLTVGRTMLTLFSLISGGQDWYDTMEDFRNNDALLAEFLLFIWIYFMMFGFLNVIVAVFCSKATEAGQESFDLRYAKQQEIQTKKVHDLTTMFRMMDKDNKGSITWQQFHDFASSSEAHTMLQTHGLTLFALQQFWQTIEGADASRPGEVDVTAFVMGFMRLSGECMGAGLIQLFVEVGGLSTEMRGLFEEQRKYIKSILPAHSRSATRNFVTPDGKFTTM